MSWSPPAWPPSWPAPCCCGPAAGTARPASPSPRGYAPHIPALPAPRPVVLAAAATLGALLTACGQDPTVDAGDARPQAQATTTQPAAPTSTTVAGKTYTSELTTTDGYRYQVTLLVGPRSATGGEPDDCPATPTPGKAHLPVTLTVANQSTDRAAPFPPVRIEMATTPGTRPGQVMVKDASGTCTFSPRVSSIGPGASVVFRGTTPAIDESATAGSAGRIEVKVSETAYSLTAPIP